MSGLPDTQLLYKVERGVLTGFETLFLLGVEVDMVNLTGSGKTHGCFVLSGFRASPSMIKLMQVELLGGPNKMVSTSASADVAGLGESEAESGEDDPERIRSGVV